MSTTPPALDVSELISKLEKRFESLKSETENILTEFKTQLGTFSEDAKKLQASLLVVTTTQEEMTKKLNVVMDEVRAIGGKNLPRVDPAPIVKEKSKLGLTMFDVFDDD